MDSPYWDLWETDTHIALGDGTAEKQTNIYTDELCSGSCKFDVTSVKCSLINHMCLYCKIYKWLQNDVIMTYSLLLFGLGSTVYLLSMYNIKISTPIMD